jgi:hypothetical protein
VDGQVEAPEVRRCARTGTRCTVRRQSVENDGNGLIVSKGPTATFEYVLSNSRIL